MRKEKIGYPALELCAHIGHGKIQHEIHHGRPGRVRHDRENTSAILLAPTTQKAWKEADWERWECRDTGRMIAVSWTLSGIEWSLCTLLTGQNLPGWSTLFLEKASIWRDETLATSGRNEFQIWAGDWNAHIGKDSEGARGIGTHFLPCPTKEVERELLRWIGEAAHDMVFVDSFRLARRRGTFMNLNGIQKDWNELDVAIVSDKNSEHDQLCAYDRHRPGVTTARKSVASIWQRGTKIVEKNWGDVQKAEDQTDCSGARMRGKSEEAEEKRGNVAEKIQEKLEDAMKVTFAMVEWRHMTKWCEQNTLTRHIFSHLHALISMSHVTLAQGVLRASRHVIMRLVVSLIWYSSTLYFVLSTVSLIFLFILLFFTFIFHVGWFDEKSHAHFG